MTRETTLLGSGGGAPRLRVCFSLIASYHHPATGQADTSIEAIGAPGLSLLRHYARSLFHAGVPADLSRATPCQFVMARVAGDGAAAHAADQLAIAPQYALLSPDTPRSAAASALRAGTFDPEDGAFVVPIHAIPSLALCSGSRGDRRGGEQQQQQAGGLLLEPAPTAPVPSQPLERTGGGGGGATAEAADGEVRVAVTDEESLEQLQRMLQPPQPPQPEAYNDAATARTTGVGVRTAALGDVSPPLLVTAGASGLKALCRRRRSGSETTAAVSASGPDVAATEAVIAAVSVSSGVPADGAGALRLLAAHPAGSKSAEPSPAALGPFAAAAPPQDGGSTAPMPMVSPGLVAAARPEEGMADGRGAAAAAAAQSMDDGGGSLLGHPAGTMSRGPSEMLIDVVAGRTEAAAAEAVADGPCGAMMQDVAAATGAVLLTNTPSPGANAAADAAAAVTTAAADLLPPAFASNGSLSAGALSDRLRDAAAALLPPCAAGLVPHYPTGEGEETEVESGERLQPREMPAPADGATAAHVGPGLPLTRSPVVPRPPPVQPWKLLAESAAAGLSPLQLPDAANSAVSQAGIEPLLRLKCGLCATAEAAGLLHDTAAATAPLAVTADVSARRADTDRQQQQQLEHLSMLLPMMSLLAHFPMTCALLRDSQVRGMHGRRVRVLPRLCRHCYITTTMMTLIGTRIPDSIFLTCRSRNHPRSQTPVHDRLLRRSAHWLSRPVTQQWRSLHPTCCLCGRGSLLLRLDTCSSQ